MNTLSSQIKAKGLHKMKYDVSLCTRAIRNLMTRLGFKEKHIQRVFTRPEFRKDMYYFASIYHIHLDADEQEELQRLVTQLDKLA